MSLAVINEDHFVNKVFHRGGAYELLIEEVDTPFSYAVVRTSVDPDDPDHPDDVSSVHAFQDAFRIEVGSKQPYRHPDYAEETRSATFDALRTLAEGIGPTARASLSTKAAAG